MALSLDVLIFHFQIRNLIMNSRLILTLFIFCLSSPGMAQKIRIADDTIDLQIQAEEALHLEPCEYSNIHSVKKAHRALAKIYHPDKAKGISSESNTPNLMTGINQAYDFLMNLAHSCQQNPHKEGVSLGLTADFLDWQQLPEILIQKDPPQDFTDTPSPPSLSEIDFDAYDITLSQIKILIKRSFYKALCAARNTPADKDVLRETYMLGFDTISKYTHAVIGVYQRLERKNTSRENQLTVVNFLISEHLKICTLVESVFKNCGSILSYDGVINSCFDKNILESIHINKKQ